MRSYAAFWVYTLLRFALFGVLWVVLWAVGVPVLFAGVVAAVLSIPLSLVLLARPRRAFAAEVEARVERRRARAERLDRDLSGTGADAPSAGTPLPPGVSEVPARSKRR